MPSNPPPTPAPSDAQSQAQPPPTTTARPSTPKLLPPLADVFGSDLNSSSANTTPPLASPRRASPPPRGKKRRRRTGRSAAAHGTSGVGAGEEWVRGMREVYERLEERRLVFLLGARDVEVQAYRACVEGREEGFGGLYGGMSKDKLVHLLVGRDVELEALREAVREKRMGTREWGGDGKSRDQVASFGEGGKAAEEGKGGAACGD